MSKLTKRILVLSGGGAKIGFMAGVTTNLPYFKNHFDGVIGVSCGAIWAAAVAMGKEKEWSKIILNLENKDIFEGSFSVWNILKKLISKKTYLLDMSPLRKLLEDNIKKEDFKIPAYFVYVDADTGEKITACSDTLDKEGIINAIMASAAIPVVMEGVENRYFDGGLEETCPLGEAIALQPDEIVIVNCFNRNQKSVRSKKNMIGIAGWAFADKMPTTIANSSVDTFLMVNEILKSTGQDSVVIDWKGKQKLIKKFKCELFEPQIDLGNSLDFSSNLMKGRYHHGFEVVTGK